MEKDGIVPDIIDEAPSAKITIIYPGGVEVEFGGELTPTQVKDQPEVKWDADPEKYYVLSMIDPDALSREDPKLKVMINHWLVVNIRGNDVSTGEVIAPYIGSKPRNGTGRHRYIFLVYEQSGRQTFEEASDPKAREKRRGFSIKEFSKKYKLGKAYAGNYYYAQWDSHVEEFLKAMEASNN